MKRARYGSFQVPLFQSRFYVAVADSADACFDALPARFRDGRDCVSTVVDGFMASKGIDAAIALVSTKRSPLQQDTITHECVHAAEHVLRAAGVKEDPESAGEVLAYVTGWMADKVVRLLRKKGKK